MTTYLFDLVVTRGPAFYFVLSHALPLGSHAVGIGSVVLLTLVLPYLIVSLPVLRVYW
jgi:hypothetical protein